MTEATPQTSSPVTSRDVAKGAGTTLLARLGAVMEVVAQPLYVAMFGLASFGLYAVLWAAVNLAENVADLGMTSSMQRVVPQAKSRQEEVSALRSAMLMGVGPCIVVAAAASLAASSVAPMFNTAQSDAAFLVHAIAVFAWSLPLWAFVEIATSALRSKRVFGAEIRLRLFWEQLLRLIITSAFWFAGFSTMALFYAHLVSLSIICLLCIRLLARYFDLALFFKGRLVDRIFHETWKAGLAVLPANIVGRLFGDGPSLALNWLLPGSAGAISGGLYAIARKISSIVQVVRIAFAYVLAPLASAASQNHVDEVRAIYGFATRVSFAIAVPLGLVLAAAGVPILNLFGSAAAMALPAVIILVIARVVETVLGAAVPIQQVTSSYWQQQLASIVGLGVAFLIGLMLMPGWGLTGMAIAVAVGFVIAAALPMAQLYWHDGLNPFFAPFGRVLALTTLFGVGGLALTLASHGLPEWLQLPVAVGLMLGSLWLSCRFALPHDDRLSMGKTGRALRLV
jgi:O-antigen/teichoic acid export membrane protein